jgi:hypothetical protein
MSRGCAFAVVLLGTATLVAGPREDVVRLLPTDAHVCVLVQQLRTQTQPGPMTQELLASAPLRAVVGGPEWAKLRQIVEQVGTSLQISPRELIDDLFGDALGFAHWTDATGQDDGLIVTYARNPQLAATVVERLNQVQKSTGELKGTAEQQRGAWRVVTRTKRGGGQEFFAFHGHLVAFSTRLAVLDRLATPANTHLALLEQLGVSGRPVVAWVNPRVYDAELQTKRARAKGDEAVFLNQFSKYWSAFAGVAVFLDWTTSVEMGVAVQMNSAALPASAQTLFAAGNVPSALWGSMPANTLSAVGGRIDGGALVETVAGFLPPATTEQIWQALSPSVAPAFGGTERFAAGLRGLGPDWALWSTPPGADEAWWPRTTLAVRVGQAGPVWSQGLQFFTTLAVVTHNNSRSDNAAFKHTTQAGTEVHYVAGGKAFPPGLQPAFATKGEYLILATTPGAVTDFMPPTALPANAEVPWVRVSAHAWRAYLLHQRKAVEQWLTTSANVSATEANQRIETVLALLALFERVELSHRAQGERVTLTLRVWGVK